MSARAFSVRFFCPFLLTLLLNAAAVACIWDRDTLASEAKGIPDTIQVITGRFERNPPLYYEMRLARVTEELKTNPARLDLYDDAAVACDRLGRHDDAITWMKKKQGQMEGRHSDLPSLKDHRYRYFANLGTFRAHRWISRGADRKRIGEMREARQLIAEAIRINPDAHFGRERYQLRVIDWIIAPDSSVVSAPYELPGIFGRRSFDAERFGRKPLKQESAEDAVKGLSGLIVLGSAWESVDVFNALARALSFYGYRSSPSYMARLRACELVDQGAHSLYPDAPTGDRLKEMIMGRGNSTHNLMGDKPVRVSAAFTDLREEAEQWHSDRMRYMMPRLQSGRHPDTTPDFWSGYRERPAPEAQDAWWLNRVQRIWFYGGSAALFSLILYRRAKKRRRRIREEG